MCNECSNHIGMSTSQGARTNPAVYISATMAGLLVAVVGTAGYCRLKGRRSINPCNPAEQEPLTPPRTMTYPSAVKIAEDTIPGMDRALSVREAGLIQHMQSNLVTEPSI